MGKLITKTLNQCKLTKAEIKRLQALAARPDSEIDLSDIPELDEKFWKNGICNPFHAKLAQLQRKTRELK